MGFLQAAAQLVLGANILFALLLGFSVLFTEPGTGPRVIVQLTLVPVVGALIASLVVIYTGWDPL